MESPPSFIDPKGDLGNLLLTFPDLRAEDFKPWVNPEEAQRKGLDVDAFAEEQAEAWRRGLAAWGEGPERIRRCAIRLTWPSILPEAVAAFRSTRSLPSTRRTPMIRRRIAERVANDCSQPAWPAQA